MPEHCGTLAAARCLAANGVRVSTASDRRFPPAAFSSAVASHHRCPGLDTPTELVDWLLDVGTRERGTVLYPTCDDFAWLQSVHDQRLRERFATYSPSEDAIDAVLDDNTHGRAVVERLPAASLPLVQAYFHEGVSGSLLVSGFIDETGELFVTRAASKVLQFPRTLGIALCLEAVDIGEKLSSAIREICLRTKYFGVFSKSCSSRSASRASWRGKTFGGGATGTRCTERTSWTPCGRRTIGSRASLISRRTSSLGYVTRGPS